MKKYIIKSVICIGILSSVLGAHASRDSFLDDDIEVGHQHKRICTPNSKKQSRSAVCVDLTMLQTPPRICVDLTAQQTPERVLVDVTGQRAFPRLCLDLAMPQTPPRENPSTFPDYSPATKASLWGQNVDPNILHSMMKSMLFSPFKKEDLIIVRDIKTRNKILNKEIVPSPCVRKAKVVSKSKKKPRVVTRSKLPKKIRFGERESVPVVHLHPSVSKQEEPKELEEERIARRRQQRAILKKARADQLGQKGDDAWSHEEATLNLFVRYLTLRKEDPSKIRKKEIEEILDEILPEAGYQSIEYENYVAWFCVKTMLLDEEDQETGLTNFDAVNMGRPPKGFDGESMHLHHATLFDGATHNKKSHLILLSNTAHGKKFAADLHFSSKFYYKPKVPVDRVMFDPKRPPIFKKIATVLEDADSQSENSEGIPILDLCDGSTTGENSESS